MKRCRLSQVATPQGLQTVVNLKSLMYGEIVVVFRDRDIGGTAMNSVDDLDVFKLAHELALKIYSVAKKFPREETYSLVDQMRRAAISVGMNLMEGAMRLGTKEYRQFVGIARGSAGKSAISCLSPAI